MAAGAVSGSAHFADIWRVIEEAHLATDLWYVLITVAAAPLPLGLALTFALDALMTGILSRLPALQLIRGLLRRASRARLLPCS